jgi:hypothetical protein
MLPTSMASFWLGSTPSSSPSWLMIGRRSNTASAPRQSSHRSGKCLNPKAQSSRRQKDRTTSLTDPKPNCEAKFGNLIPITGNSH